MFVLLFLLISQFLEIENVGVKQYIITITVLFVTYIYFYIHSDYYTIEAHIIDKSYLHQAGKVGCDSATTAGGKLPKLAYVL